MTIHEIKHLHECNKSTLPWKEWAYNHMLKEYDILVSISRQNIFNEDTDKISSLHVFYFQDCYTVIMEYWYELDNALQKSFAYDVYTDKQELIEDMNFFQNRIIPELLEF